MKGPLGALTQILVTVGIMISFFLGIPIPEFKYDKVSELYYPTEIKTFETDNYWRVIFCIPIGIALVQSILLFTVFNYETPKFFKQNNQLAKLNELMGKIYEIDKVRERIDAIVIETGKGSSPGYKETMCSPRYRYATFIGCSLSFL